MVSTETCSAGTAGEVGGVIIADFREQLKERWGLYASDNQYYFTERNFGGRRIHVTFLRFYRREPATFETLSLLTFSSPFNLSLINTPVCRS
jgi:hypothetical protein